VYFSRESDEAARKKIAAERNRLISKLGGEKRAGTPMRAPEPSWQYILSCGDHGHHHGLITTDQQEGDEENN
jgi:hypothetical protein